MKKLIDKIDKKDLKVLEILTEDSSLSTHKISKKTLIPVTTVNNRIKKLRKHGVIKKYTIEIDKTKLGFNLSAYIFINISLAELKEAGMKTQDLIKTIRKNPLIESVEHVTGNIDIILKMHMRSVQELNDYVVNTLSTYKGVGKTNTLFVLIKE